MKRLSFLLFAAVIVALVASCAAPAPKATPSPVAGKFQVVVIGKSVHPYWSNVEKGVRAAAKDLGLADDQVIFFVPPKEDVAAQIQTMETYIAQGVTGIAVAPSDPNALEPAMKKAADAGIIVTTLDTPPVEGSVSLVYIGTNNYAAGEIAGEQMVNLLPGGGTVGIGRGSDTALNALQRTDGFLDAIDGTDIVALEPVNDKEDAARALELANSVISANPDLAGAFGVYAYNGPAWATAIKEANAVGKIKLVSFDATTDIINGIKEGVIDATVAQREFDQGYKSVQLIYLIATKGEAAAMSEMGVVEGIIDTGVDVITAATLKDYEATLDKKGIPHEWTTEGWQPPAAEKVTFTWWHIQTAENERALWQKLADDYRAAHPNVTIEITWMENEAFKAKLTTVMQSGNPPDLFQSWGGGVMNEYAKAGLLKDITADLDKDGWRDTFSPGALGVYSFQGINYGVPRDMGMVGFWYNKDLFAQAGIDAPPETWSELLEDVQKLKDAGITPIAVGGKDKWPGAFWWEYLAVRIGGKAAFDAAYSRTGAFTDAPFVEAGTKLQELVALEPFQDGFLGATWGDEATLMGNGKAAMDLMGQWAPGAFKDNSVDKLGLGDKAGWFPFPAVEGGVGDPADALGGGNGFIVGKNAPPETVDFLKFISSVDSQRAQAEIGLSVPVVKGAEDALTDPLLKIVQQGAAAAQYFQLYYDQAMPPAVGSVVNDAVQGLFAGTLTPEQAAQAVEDSAETELQ